MTGGYVPSSVTAAELYKAAETIASGYVPDAGFMAALAQVIRTDAMTTEIIGREWGGFAPWPLTIHLAKQIAKETNQCSSHHLE